MGPLWPISNRCNPFLSLEVSLGGKSCLVRALSPLLFDNSIYISFTYVFRKNFPFLPQSAGVGMPTPCPAFSVGANDLSSGPHTCRANTLAHWEFRPGPAGSGLSSDCSYLSWHWSPLTLALESCHWCPCIVGGLVIVWKVDEIIGDFPFIVSVF